MTKQAMPAVSILSKDTLEEFKSADKVVLVAYYDAKDSKSNETFEAVANSLRDSYLFGATNDPELAKADGVKVPGVVLYKQFDEGKAVFDGKFDTESIEQFAKTFSVPLIGEVGPETYAGYMAVSPSPCLLAFQGRKPDTTLGPTAPCVHLRRDRRGARGIRQGLQGDRREAQGQDQHRHD